VFGCGGDRDAGKRPEMGAVAAQLADRVTITDDNPRTEDAHAIRTAILNACPNAAEIGDRADAIRAAIEKLDAGDGLLIAGKGHETGQVIGTQTHPFNDADAIRSALTIEGEVP
jgi:UDP-N-acetylmuramoyl-L-alanyl-D-glutamate--2,6-diaminopimelate ligase